MITNDARVENQDNEKVSSKPVDSSCLKRLKSIIFKEKEVELKITTEKVMELLQPVCYKPIQSIVAILFLATTTLVPTHWGFLCRGWLCIYFYI